MKLQGKRIAYLVGPGFEDLEFYVPFMRLQEEGAEVVAVGLKAGEIYTGKVALQAKADVGCDDISASEFDGVVVPGGWAPDKIRRYAGVKRLVKESYDSGKIVGMIGAGGHQCGDCLRSRLHGQRRHQRRSAQRRGHLAGRSRLSQWQYRLGPGRGRHPRLLPGVGQGTG